jgi:hypothetical protein
MGVCIHGCRFGPHTELGGDFAADAGRCAGSLAASVTLDRPRLALRDPAGERDCRPDRHSQKPTRARTHRATLTATKRPNRSSCARQN